MFFAPVRKIRMRMHARIGPFEINAHNKNYRSVIMLFLGTLIYYEIVRPHTRTHAKAHTHAREGTHARTRRHTHRTL